MSKTDLIEDSNPKFADKVTKKYNLLTKSVLTINNLLLGLIKVRNLEVDKLEIEKLFPDTQLYKARLYLKHSEKHEQLVYRILKDIEGVTVYQFKEKNETIWVPLQITDLDYCCKVRTDYEPCLDSTHPGFNDKVYQARRKEIAKIAEEYKMNTLLPTIEYNDTEIETWKMVYISCRKNNLKYGSETYVRSFAELEKSGLYSEDFIPQLKDLSRYLKKKTGFQLKPVSGLLSARDFLSSLAFKVFQCTQYIRHRSCQFHTPEPDVIHELLGHIPMLADPEFAEFSHLLGLASLGVSDEDMEKLTALYWFTVEFGLCKEGNELKVFGAGILSSPGELRNAISDDSEKKEFVIDEVAEKSFQDVHYQDTYFVIDNFKDACNDLTNFSRFLQNGSHYKYEAKTNSLLEMMA